jgi:hypothetical protein
MTSLSVSSVGQTPLPLFQALTGQQPTTGAPPIDGTQTGQAQGGHHHHHHGGGGGGAVSDLLNTIASALQSADSSADPNKVIEDTVAKLISGNGTTAGATGTTATDADGDSDGSTQAAGQSSTAQSFAQLLQAHGVDFQQFRSDLLAAVKDAQNGQVNPSTALQSFPAGSSLNLTA